MKLFSDISEFNFKIVNNVRLAIKYLFITQQNAHQYNIHTVTVSVPQYLSLLYHHLKWSQPFSPSKLTHHAVHKMAAIKAW